MILFWFLCRSSSGSSFSENWWFCYFYSNLSVILQYEPFCRSLEDFSFLRFVSRNSKHHMEWLFAWLPDCFKTASLSLRYSHCSKILRFIKSGHCGQKHIICLMPRYLQIAPTHSVLIFQVLIRINVMISRETEDSNFPSFWYQISMDYMSTLEVIPVVCKTALSHIRVNLASGRALDGSPGRSSNVSSICGNVICFYLIEWLKRCTRQQIIPYFRFFFFLYLCINVIAALVILAGVKAALIV